MIPRISTSSSCEKDLAPQTRRPKQYQAQAFYICDWIRFSAEQLLRLEMRSLRTAKSGMALLSPSPHITEIFLWIVTSPISQHKPKMLCVFSCLDCMFIIGCLFEESLREEMQLRICLCADKADLLTKDVP